MNAEAAPVSRFFRDTLILRSTPTVFISLCGDCCFHPLPFQNTRGAFWDLFWDVVGSSPTHGYPPPVPVQFWVRSVKRKLQTSLELRISSG